MVELLWIVIIPLMLVSMLIHILFATPIFLVPGVPFEVAFGYDNLHLVSVIVAVVHIVVGHLDVDFDMVEVLFASPEDIYDVALSFGLTAQKIHLFVEVFLILGAHL